MQEKRPVSPSFVQFEFLPQTSVHPTNSGGKGIFQFFNHFDIFPLRKMTFKLIVFEMSSQNFPCMHWIIKIIELDKHTEGTNVIRGHPQTTWFANQFFIPPPSY